MKQARHHQFGVQIVTAGGNQLRHFNQVVQVRLAAGAFPFLLSMILRGKMSGGKNAPHGR